MVVMTPEATPAQIETVVERLERAGVHAKVMPGELTTAIGASAIRRACASWASRGSPAWTR